MSPNVGEAGREAVLPFAYVPGKDVAFVGAYVVPLALYNT